MALFTMCFSSVSLLIGLNNFSFLPITITGQNEVTVYHEGDLEIILDFLDIDYDGDLDNLTLQVLWEEGDEYVVNGNTITMTNPYETSWPAAGEIVPVRVQLSDGVDESAVFELQVLVIPPIQQIEYAENGCQGTFTFSASAYKPSNEYVGSFPFIFQLFDSNDVLVEEQEVDYLDIFDNSATAIFAGVNEPLDGNEEYRIEITDGLGRTFSRQAGPLGQAYALDFDLNFSGMICPEDPRGLVEFIIYNAALPLVEFQVLDENGNEVFSQLEIVREGGGFIVVQALNLGAGKYTLEISDRYTCNGEEEFEIVIPGPVVHEAELNDISCPNANDGAIQILIEGGWSQPFEGNPREEWAIYGVEWFTLSGNSLGPGEIGFVEDNGNIVGVEAMMENLGPGDYYAVITDNGRLSQIANVDPLGCVIQTSVYSLQGPEPIALNSGFQSISCNGAENGEITVNPTGGTPGLTISWFSGNFEEEFAPVVEDLVPLPPQTGDSDLQRLNLGAGTYVVLVEDVNGCFLAENFEILEPESFSISEVSEDRVNVGCFGEPTGEIKVQIDQTTSSPYLFQIHLVGENPGSTQEITDNGAAPYTFQNLPAGTYQIIISDANGCQEILDDILITQPEDGLEISNVELSDYNGYQISCFEAMDGFIEYEVNGGLGELSFSWQGPDGFAADSQNLTGIGSGIYQLTITEASGCTLTREFELIQPEPLTAAETTSDFGGFEIQCYGGNEGYIHLNVKGGSGTYAINWTGPDGFISSEPELNDLLAGSYEVNIQDENGCGITQIYEMTEPLALEIIEIPEEKQDVECFGQETGKLGVAIRQTSNGPYTYYLQREGEGLGSMAQSPSTRDTVWVFENLPAGVFDLTVVDVNNCVQDLQNLEIDQPETGIQIDDVQISTYNGFNISCFGVNDGWIEVDVSGGSGNFLYEWTGPDGFTEDQPSVSSLAPGVYQLIITDEKGCTLGTGPLEIIEPEPLALNAEPTNFNGYGISCFGAKDGRISLSPQGGSGTYAVSWTGPGGFSSPSEIIENLSPGQYEVVVSDENGCEVVVQFDLSEPALLEGSLVDKVDVLCFGESTGSINLDISGGASRIYRFEWFRDGAPIAETSQNLNSLPAGNYEVNVFDENECSISLSDLLISEPESHLEINFTQTEISCYNANDANLSLETNGGVEPYQISWNIGSKQTSFTGIGPGYYEVTVTDANGCQLVKATNIEDVPEFEVTPEIQQVSCHGANDGAIQLNLVGGEAPVLAQWDHGPEQSALYNLGPGEYQVTITESRGCAITSTFNISEPDLLVVAPQVQDALACEDGQSGSIDLTVSGGVPPYSYTWSNGETTPSLSNLTNGTYSVDIMDQSGCFVNQTYRINRPAPIQVDMVATREIQCEPRTITDIFDLNITGGVAPYDISWSSGEVSENGYRMSTSSPGTYVLVVTDGYGCTYSTSYETDSHQVLLDLDFESSSKAQFQANLVNFDVQFINNSSGNIEEFHWDFGDGNQSNLKEPIHRYMEEGNYKIHLLAKDAYGCQTETTFEIEIWDYFLEIPNVFSPNGDGLNDHFMPKFIQLASIDFTIMNKWGEIVFHTDDMQSRGWDGFHQGKEPLPGNYVYVFKFITADGRAGSKNGALMLLR
ncbi:MAG: gliding motility-associated C-terminal domain-containing protein [Cyclobacteriaceae bacterium]